MEPERIAASDIKNWRKKHVKVNASSVRAYANGGFACSFDTEDWPCMTENYIRMQEKNDELAAEATRYREALERLLAWISGEVRDREYRRAWHAYNDTEGGGAEADRLNALHDQREVAIKAAREALATGQEAHS